MKLILLRHGESEWNLLNKFTGWTDVDLTENGINEAKFSGQQILKENISINTLYTSLLIRAIHTANIVSTIIGFDKNDIQYDWRLNERHYGALQGLNKSETAAKYGEEQVHIWRRSYDIPPPFLSEDDNRHPKFNEKFKDIDRDLPIGESLKNVIERLNPFWEQCLKNIKSNSGNHLIVAHSNSLRAIVKILDNLSDEEIVSVNIPTGVPLVYRLDNNFNVIDKKFLIDKNSLNLKLSAIHKQGKAKG
tara:strand:- start:4003 stop:4746 length:744 start_codon:yes stop_codon:yes gene_type:complete